jgi:5'-3' exonuclease
VRLHLVDGTFELFRAHYSKRPDRSFPDGRPAKATLGLASSLLRLTQDPVEAPTHLAVAFDNPIVSFRNRLFAGYKSDEGMDPDLRGQFDDAEEATRAMGIAVWSMKDHEADDAIATAVARFGEQVEAVRILSPDKDFGQLLRQGRVVLVDRIRNREIDETALKARLGIGPRSVPDFLALVGDDADGIPGLPGFGEKGAAALLAAFGKLEEIPQDVGRWPAMRQRETMAATLRARWEDALLYRRLATLVEDAPIDASLDALAWKGVPRQRFSAWCAAVGATDLATLPARWNEDG